MTKIVMGIETLHFFERFEKIATRKPIRVDIPTTEPPLKQSSGNIVSAIIVSIAPAAIP